MHVASKVRLAYHYRQRLQLRKVTLLDGRNVIERGVPHQDPPEFNEHFWEWRYKVKGFAIDQKTAIVITFAIDETADEAVLVTAYL